MCLIIASPTGKRISDKILEEAAQNNRDGAGLAWLECADKRIQYRKGLDVPGVIALLDGEAKGKPWIVHFRIATHGAVCPELTHPFTIDADASIARSGDADAVLFHNGTFSSWKEYLLQAAGTSGTPVPESPWSDTRAIAFCLGVYGKHMLSILDNSSRFVVFDAKDKVESRMLMWGDWHTWDEFKFSNRSTSAFHTHSSSNFSNPRTQSSGGGSGNFQKAAAAGVENAGDTANNTAAGEEASPTSAGTPLQTRLSDARPHETVRDSRSNSRAYSPKPGRDIWKSFSKEGLYIVAANEAQPTA